jgi:carboxyl-terminal processing protease
MSSVISFLRCLPLLALLAVTPMATIRAEDANANDTFRQLTLFSDVLERVRSDYVDEVTDDKLIESAINGMLVSLDPHSAYLNKKNFQEMQTQTRGEFGGLGLEVTMDSGLVKVVSPIDGTPAANAGLQPSDFITHIDNKPVADLSLSEAVDKMRGPPGSKVTLTLRRGGLMGTPFDVTLTRAVIRIQSVRFRQEGSDVGYLRITTFNEQTQEGLDKAINELTKTMGDKLIGYVIDLRNNPGGLLDQAVSVSGTFLDEDQEVVSTRGRHSDDNQSFKAKGGDRAKGKPIVVLINGGSASASEIVAGALQDHRRGIVIGTKSFGKGSVQTIIPIAGSGAMRLTTARYYTPSGRSIQQLGIEPDIAVQPAKLEELAQAQGIREADLKGALPNPTGGLPVATPVPPVVEATPSLDKKDDDKSGDKGSEKKEPFDYQLARGIDLLRGVYLFENKGKPVVPVKGEAGKGETKPADKSDKPDKK